VDNAGHTPAVRLGLLETSVRLMLQERGDRPFKDVLAGLGCRQCGGRPAPVYLVAGLTRTFCFGPPPSWAVELVPPPE